MLVATAVEIRCDQHGCPQTVVLGTKDLDVHVRAVQTNHGPAVYNLRPKRIATEWLTEYDRHFCSEHAEQRLAARRKVVL